MAEADRRGPVNTLRSHPLGSAAAVLAVIGVVLSGYLAIENLNGNTGVCVGVQGCHTVQSSRYGKIIGVPVSIPGFLLYAGLATGAVLWIRDVAGRSADWAFLGFIGALGGVLMSAYLTYVEAFVLHAWCSYCIVSAVLMVLLFIAWSSILVTTLRRAD